ncbi:MAG: sugar phosphate isomerase/epimerase [Candidatus Hydrogenedens sp.]|jgi:sugar phosphate isomerase/epimerase|nr:sugar phosphate isomerase/epimerase [Candidatus Hydrogenedens sp.]
MSHYPYALQLYSIRDHCMKNLQQALAPLSRVGYKWVELAGLYGKSAAEFKSYLDQAALTAISMHVSIEELASQPEKVLRQAQTLRTPFIVVPWLGEEQCPDRPSWIDAALLLDKLGEQFLNEGHRLCYHNHAHEFARFGTDRILDLIMKTAHPDHLHLELDLGWAAAAGADLSELLVQYQGRIPLVHIKDYRLDADGKTVVFTELGKGIIPWRHFLPEVKQAGIRFYIVEQDESEGDALESALRNGQYMGKFNF